MEYTKDIVLNLKYKKKIGANIFKQYAGFLLKFIKQNKLISITLIAFITLITIDIALINSFLQILTNLS